MDEARRMRRQIRAVLIVFRAERRHLEPLIESGEAPRSQLEELRARSMEVLDVARA